MKTVNFQNKYLKSIVYALSALLFLASFGWLYWLSDLLKLFLDYFVLFLLIAVGFSFWRRIWPMVALGLFFCLWGVILMFNFSSVPSSVDAEPNLRLMVYNVHFENEDAAAVQAEISRQNPEILYLMEYPSDANPAMRLDLEAEYPYQLIEPSRFTMGVALFSKYPIVESKVHKFADTRIPIIEATVEIEGETVTFVGGHPWPPQPQWGQLHRNQLDEIVSVAAGVDQQETPLIVAGDFNTPPSAYMLRKLSHDAQVAQVRTRFDLGKTFNLFPFVGFPLDHVFVSDGVAVVAYQYGSAAGSDHLPIVVDLALNK